MRLDLLLRKVQSRESVRSPPPERAPLARMLRRRRRRAAPTDKFAGVRCAVDTRPPALRPALLLRGLQRDAPRALRLQQENLRLLRLIRDNHFNRGRVDCRWASLPAPCPQYHRARVDFCARVHQENRRLHRLLDTAKPRLPTTAELEERWAALRRARPPGWALSPPPPRPDPAFDPPPGVLRPRVCVRLRVRGGAALGGLRLELFSEACPRTAALFLALLHAPRGYRGTRFYRAIDYLYPAGEAGAGAARYKLVRVADATTLHDLLSLARQNIASQEELLLVERRVPEAGALWDLGAVRAPAPAAVAAATAALPPPAAPARQPNLQALLSTNELSHELRKILISLVEAGARLAAAGPHYEHALAQLSAALQPPRPVKRPVVEVITPEEIAQRMSAEAAEEAASSDATAPAPAGPDDAFRRAEHLQRFLDAFRAWRVSRAEAPSAEALGALTELGFAADDAEGALRRTGGSAPAAAAWLLGERGSSVFELVDGLPDGLILQTLLKQPQIQRGLLNTRMLAAFVAMVGQAGSAALWLSSPHGSPLLGQISRTYHSEKYCLAVNQFSEQQDATRPAAPAPAPSTSRQR